MSNEVTTPPAAMAALAVQQGLPVETIERMWALQVAYEVREAEKAYNVAFAAFRADNLIIPKTLRVDRGKAGSFTQAEYDQVCSRLSPALAKHGFGFSHDQKFGSRKWTTDGVENDIAWVWVTCWLKHSAGHAESVQLEGPPGDLSANTPVQNMQTTASYLKRQSLLAITGTATGGEDDESKMRGAAKDGHAGSEDYEALINEGRSKAMEGMPALTAWWGGLSSKERADLNKDFGSLRRAASTADRGVDHA